jgi:hypothetical protein
VGIGGTGGTFVVEMVGSVEFAGPRNIKTTALMMSTTTTIPAIIAVAGLRADLGAGFGTPVAGA